MKYCSSCGSLLSFRVPEGDDRKRHSCDSCGVIHYQNPRVVVGCLPIHEDKVLLCKRAIEPRRGCWTLPAGYLENGETTMEGAARETWEETRARVYDQQLYRVFDIPQIDQIYMFFRTGIENGHFGEGPESIEVGLFAEEHIPWQELAFRPVYETLKEYFLDRRSARFPVRSSKLLRWR